MALIPFPFSHFSFVRSFSNLTFDSKKLWWSKFKLVHKQFQSRKFYSKYISKINSLLQLDAPNLFFFFSFFFFLNSLTFSFILSQYETTNRQIVNDQSTLTSSSLLNLQYEIWFIDISFVPNNFSNIKVLLEHDGLDQKSK